jgi:2-methylcitrate dehydratase PrpD
MKVHGLHADDIERVEVGVSRMTHVHCAWEYKAQGVTAAQMNLYYGLAVIAHDGAAFVRQYREDRLADPRLLDFMKRIVAHVDPEIDAMGPAFRHAASVSVRTRSGRAFSHRILNRRGSPESPLSADEVEHKFRNVVESCLRDAEVDRIVALVRELDSVDDVNELIALLAAPRPSAQTAAAALLRNHQG